MFNSIVCFSPFPLTLQIHQIWKADWVYLPMSKGHPKEQGPGWTELSCVCLSTLAVQNIRSPVQQAQTGSHTTTQPEWQPAIERKQPSHRSTYTKSYSHSEGPGAWGFELLL